MTPATTSPNRTSSHELLRANGLNPVNDFTRTFQRKVRMTGLLAAVTLVTAEMSGISLVWLGVLVLANVLARHWLDWNNRPLQPVAVTALVLLATVATLVEFINLGTDIILALGHYMLLVEAIRTLERRRARDYAQSLLLSGLVMVIAAVVSSSVLYAVLLMAYLWMGTHAVLLLQLAREAERRREALLAGGLDSSWVLASEPLTTAGPVAPLRRYAAVVAVVILVLGFMVAACLPRGLGGFLGDWQARPQVRVTGFNETVDFSSSGRLNTDDTVVMHVRLTDSKTGKALPPGSLPTELMFLRGATQELFRGDHWTSQDYYRRRRLRSLVRTRAQLNSLRQETLGPTEQGRAIRQEVTLYEASNPNLFTLYPPSGVETPPTDDVELDLMDLTLRADRPLRGAQHYVVESVLPTPERLPALASVVDKIASSTISRGRSPFEPYTDDAVPPPLDTEFRPPTTLPGKDYARRYRHPQRGWLLEPTVRRRGELDTDARLRFQQWEEQLTAYAQQVLEQSAGSAEAAKRLSPRRKVELLQSHLQVACRYSLDDPPGINQEGRPVMDFLFQYREGNCRFFASALVLLCRTSAVDVPARLVTGYRLEEYNVPGEFYVVRGSHGHAWVEVHLPVEGWTTFDPTPAASEEPTGFWLWESIRQSLQFADQFWGENVLSYNQVQRDQLGGALGRWFTGQGLNLSNYRLLELLAERPTTRSTPSLERSVTLLGGALLFLLGVWRIWASGRGGTVLGETSDKSAATVALPHRAIPKPVPFFDRTTSVLAELGYQRLPSATPREFVEFLARVGEFRSRPELAGLPRLTELLYQCRYAERPLTPEQQAEADGILARLAAGVSCPPTGSAGWSESPAPTMSLGTPNAALASEAPEPPNGVESVQVSVQPVCVSRPFTESH